MTQSAFESRRITRSCRQTIDASPDAVFPLLCPVREPEWLDGWQCRMFYTSSGRAEEGAVFSTSSPGEDDTVWVITRHDPLAREVHFTRFTPHSRTCLLTIAVHPCGEQRSHLDVRYSYTSIAPPGDRFLDSWSEESFLEAMTFWERSMNHYLKTGTLLPRVS